MELSIGLWRLYDLAVKAVNLAAVNTSMEQLSEHIRISLCNFQLRYTNYHFMASRKHKDFKESFTKNPDNSKYHYNEMIQFIEMSMPKLCGDLAESIREYFALTHRHREAPRVSIYLVDDKDNLVDIIMIPRDKNMNNTPKRIENNTCFMYVCAEGTPYLTNNLPKIARKDKSLLHEGLDVEKIKNEYKPKLIDKKLIARFRNNFFRYSKLDEEWNNMSDNKNTIQFLYKSHLVVPITYRMHADAKRLDSHMVKTLQLRESGRSILGFICVDHPATYYFDNGHVKSYENIDINIMYVFADMLSLIFVTWLMYTTGSSCSNNYLHHFGEK